MNANHSTFYMSLALHLAEQGRLTVSPNPMVGCVIVKNNQIIGQGYHQQAGKPHAEILALKEAKEQAEGATLYVTLEPCCHDGRTPPCAAALIEAKIKKVYVACVDPNPLVSGKGIEALRKAGIEVEVGSGEQEAKRLNETFFH
ncbi:MAG: bifunctional diaminohydroxyphosphoribosylaminopyrimidine deaminase/5-amino-6-(5-phosphoribosylamino)uracil reductase RibD, partial [Gammaproteobacteria bacterium]